jgi:hypothetical protein
MAVPWTKERLAVRLAPHHVPTAAVWLGSLMLQVDPAIIGGVILSMGDKYVDLSILARVKKLQQIVRDAV